MGHKGFTLIEVLITVTILAILASTVMPRSNMSLKRAKDTELRENLRTIRKAIDEYKRVWDEGRIKKNAGESGYPPDIKTLVDGVDDAASPQSGKKIRFLRRIPRDPMNPETSIAPHETWRLRSYQSGPDDPKEGDDVFDVYSRSDDTAIDGTLYKTW